MLIGHYSVALAAKAFEPRIPLWLLFLVVQFIDIVWAVLVLAGVEKVRLDAALQSGPPGGRVQRGVSDPQGRGGRVGRR